MIDDLDGDSKDDLAVGVPSESIGGVTKSGVISVYHFTIHKSPLIFRGAETYSQSMFGKPTDRDMFGYSLAAGDFSGEPSKQLVVGTPYIGFEGRQKPGWAFVFRDANVHHSMKALYSFGQ